MIDEQKVRSLFQSKTDSEYGKAKSDGVLFWRAIGKEDSELTDELWLDIK